MVSSICWPYFDPEYESMHLRINPPRVCIDNDASEEHTVIKVDSANKHGILLEVVQLLTDLDLTISKAYISSDGGWFMDVFHVTDQLGNKLMDQNIIDYIEHTLGGKRSNSTGTVVKTCLGKTVGIESIGEYTAIELTGADRLGLLSEISMTLADLECNVVAAEFWTHNSRIACVAYVTDKSTNRAIDDPVRLSKIKEQLSSVLKWTIDSKGSKTDFSMGLTHTERRLHQLMFADRDYECCDTSGPGVMSGKNKKPVITIENCNEKGYSVVTVKCIDRPKLLFDTVCTLTDMQYVVFHASIRSNLPDALQEYYIRHLDGCILDTESEKQRVIKCLEAAIERRVPEGLSLELHSSDRVGLLSDIACLFRENGLSVTRADVNTRGNKAINLFYVRDPSGKPVDMKVMQEIKDKIGPAILQVKNMPSKALDVPSDEKFRFSFGSLFKLQFDRLSYNFKQ